MLLQVFSLASHVCNINIIIVVVLTARPGEPCGPGGPCIPGEPLKAPDNTLFRFIFP